MTQRENEINNQVVDLTEITRQQAEYIIELEMEIAEITDKWEFLNKELDEIKTREIMEKEIYAS